MAYPMVAAAHPVGNAIARQEEQNTTRTTALGFIPPAKAVLAAMGTIIATVPLFDKKLVMITVVMQNTVMTSRLLGLLPSKRSTRLPTNSPAPEELKAEDITRTPATIQIISLVSVATASCTDMIFVKIKTSTPTAGIT